MGVSVSYLHGCLCELPSWVSMGVSVSYLHGCLCEYLLTTRNACDLYSCILLHAIYVERFVS